MPPSPRAAALDVVKRVLKGTPWDTALSSSTGFSDLEGRDRAFAFRLAAGSLRHYNLSKQVLKTISDRPVIKPPELETLCIMGVAQILFLDVPAHAAVNETVNMSPQPQKGLVNALLRRAEREKEQILKDLDIGRYALPKFLFDQLSKDYGEATAREIALFSLNEPALDITVKDDPEHWTKELNAETHEFGSLRLVEPGAIQELPGYDAGAWWVQDAAASVPVRSLGDLTDKIVLDMCAAPGGKTLQLAAAGAKVTALDISANRMAVAEDNAYRCGLDDRISFEIGDARKYHPAEKYEIVVIDAPCSASGTIRRHPDMWVEKEARDLERLMTIQDDLLDKAVSMLQPGGTILFITCSLDKREGEARAAAFEKRHAQFKRQTDPQQSRILPHKHATDGFFFCAFAQEL